jgi:hypothetical protein
VDALSLFTNVIAGAVAVIATVLVAWAQTRIGKRSLKKSEEKDAELTHNTEAFLPEQIYNIRTSGDVNIAELPSSGNIVVNIQSVTEGANLEYRVAVLEGYIEWMFNNGLFIRSINSEEIAGIQEKAAQLVKRRFPDAEVEVAGVKSDVGE